MQTKLLTSVEAAELLNVRPGTLAAWAFRGEGPAFVKVGRLRRYTEKALASYTKARTVSPVPADTQ